MYAFTRYLKEEVERILNNKPPVIEDGDVEVSNITFAFNNHKMINTLRKRGQAIIKANDEQEEEFNKEMDRLKDENLEDFTTPISAFISFETQEGHERAIKLKKVRKCFFYEEYNNEDDILGG